MLDIRRLREDAEGVKANLARRNDPKLLEAVDDLVAWDREWRDLLEEANALKHRRNVVTEAIAKAKKAGDDPTDLLAEAAGLPDRIAALDERLEALRTRIDRGLLALPNLLDDAVPAGKEVGDNVELRRWGEPRTPAHPLRPHGEVLEALGLADFERARKVSGAGFHYALGDLVRLDLALLRFALDRLVARGYTPVLPPFLLRRRPYEGVTSLDAFEQVMYKVEGEDLYLIATSEHPIGAMFLDEVLDEDDLPLRYAGLSTNFRREIGAHGVDTKGLFRMHQFNKVEQFVFCAPEDSPAIHEELIGNAEALYQALGLPHRVVNVCTGDIGQVAAKQYDLEAWFPRQGAYAEVGSCSNCTDYQARRLNIRMGKVGGAKRVPHTLNATALATSRTLVALLEHYQREDGTVAVPEALVPYLDGQQVLGDPGTA